MLAFRSHDTLFGRERSSGCRRLFGASIAVLLFGLLAAAPVQAAGAAPGAAAAPAHAADAAAGAPAAPAHETSVRASLGVGSPVGFAGAIVTRHIMGPLRGEGGLGLGLSGVVVSLMPKVVIGDIHRFVAGAGVSVSLPWPLGSVLVSRPGGDGVVMPWLDLDIAGYELRLEDNWIAAASAGLTINMRRAHWDIADLGRDLHAWTPLVQGRIMLGHIF